MTFDCFMYYNEADLLRVRLAEHDSFVDCFVITELNQTHSGQPKAQNFDINLYPEFAHKIKYCFVDADLMNRGYPLISPGASRNLQENREHWGRENFQRNYSQVLLAHLGAIDSDVILSSDLDEIIDRKTYNKCLNYIEGNWRSGIAKVKQRHRCFKFNLVSSTNVGYGPRVMFYRTYKLNDPSLMREFNEGDTVCEGGWHFSYLSKDKANILNKMRAFSHAYQHGDVNSVDDAFDKLERHNYMDVKEEIDGTYPKELREHPERYRDYIA